MSDMYWWKITPLIWENEYPLKKRDGEIMPDINDKR